MNSYLLLYTLTRLDYVDNFCTPIALATLFYLAIWVVIYTATKSSTPYISSFDSKEEKEKKQTEYETLVKTIDKFFYPKISIAIIIFCTLVNFLTPTKNEALVILAWGKTIDYVSNNKYIQAIPDKTAQIVVSYLDKTLEELKTKTK